MLKFSKKDPNREVERQRIEKESRDAIESAVGHAQNCLKNDDFLKYKNAYELAQKKLFAELVFLDETETDPVRYGFKAKDIISKMRHIGFLLDGVLKDSGKGMA